MTFSVTNIDVRDWTHVNKMRRGKYLWSLKKHEIKRQQKFELTDKIKDLFYSMEYVEYNNSVGRNIINEYHLKYFKIV